jgi:hypothetical protein
MPTTLREMALTLDLVARTAHVVEDAGPSPGAVYMTDPNIRTRPGCRAGCQLHRFFNLLLGMFKTCRDAADVRLKELAGDQIEANNPKRTSSHLPYGTAVFGPPR